MTRAPSSCLATAGLGLALAAGLTGCVGEMEPTVPPLPTVRARPLTDIAFARTPERIERGRYLADAAIGCVLCHSERDERRPGAPPVAGREYAGVVLEEAEGYRLVAPNLTPDPETGAGAWSDDMLARAIREGVGHDGRALGGPMWWWSFRQLSDEDLASIVVYLRSLPPVRHALPPRILSAAQEAERARQAEPLLEPVPARNLADPIERGRYLIEVADCMGCHTAWEGSPNPGGFAGGNRISRGGHQSFSANLTPDPAALGGWTEAIFVGAMRQGRGGALDPIMPWAAYRGMTDEDLGAIYQTLRLAPPVRHWVNNSAPPTPCAVCGQEHGLGEKNVPPVFARVEVDLGPLTSYTGRFQLEGKTFWIEISVDESALFASEEGGPPIELVPVAGGRFEGRGLTSPIAFERDETGAVTALLTFELGPDRWERVR